MKPSVFYIRKPWVRWLDNYFAPKMMAAYRGLVADGRAQEVPQEYFVGAPWQAFASRYGLTEKDVIREPLYSIKVYAAAGYTTRNYFDENFNTATAGLADTNMTVAGQLPAGEAFLVTNVRCLPFPARADYDTAAAGTPVSFGEVLETLIRACWMEWWILQKPFLRIAPLAGLPAAMGPDTVVAGAATVLRNISWPSNGSPNTNSLYLLQPPRLLQPLENFYVTARWDAARAWTTAGRFGFWLDGLHARNIQ